VLSLKISLIIPTRERSHYLYYALQTALQIKDDNIEIIVSDNFSHDNTSAVVERFTDTRLKYIRTPNRVSMRENFNIAALASTGDYIIFFGDDDGILPKQFRYLRRILEEYHPDGISWQKSSYIWPNDETGKKFGGKKAGQIRLYGKRTFGLPNAYNPKEKFSDDLMNCRLKSFTSMTPNIYHGCVSRKYLEKNTTEKNVFFDSTIPDVNFRYRSIMIGGNFIHVDHPFSINGDSAVSNGRAHNGYSPGDIRAKPAEEFHKENAMDPYLNVFGNYTFTPLLMMATLETLRRRILNSNLVPNFSAWYSYVYKQAKVSLPHETFKIVVKSLEDYAIETGTLEEFNSALQMRTKKNKKTAKEIFSRIQTVLSTFKLSANKDGENNILSAVNIYDEILSSSFESVLNDKKMYKKEWSITKDRARNRV